MADEHDRYIQALEPTAEQAAYLISSTFEPLWKAHVDVLKTFITVTTASFAGIIAFSEQVLGEASTVGVIVMTTSLVFLLGSLGASLFGLWRSVGLRSFRASFFNSKQALTKSIRELDPTAQDFARKLDELVGPAIGDALEPLAQADEVVRKALHSSGLLLGLALIGFIGFVIVEFLVEPNQSLQQTLDPAAVPAVAEPASASSAAEHRR